MRDILKKIIVLILSLFVFIPFLSAYGADEAPAYTQYRSVDLGSFNEYRYKLTKEFFELRESFQVNSRMTTETLVNIQNISKESYNYLPDNLTNENYLNNLSTSIKKALNNLDSEVYYIEVAEKLGEYIEKVDIEELKGSVVVTPDEGNAPLNVTLRAQVVDPEGTVIPKNNYIWWIDQGGSKKIIGTGLSINYTLTEEGTYSVFVDVKSVHKNSQGYVDVLPWRGKAIIKVKEKVASLIVKVNSESLRYTDELKFTPEQARYGLLFDATSSIPTGGAKFIETSWDFGNGIERKYEGEPKVERVIYTKEGDYTVELKLKTNLGNTVTKKFTISIHDPIATINISPEEGFLGDKFTFSTKTVGNDDNLTYDWEIVDVTNDVVIKRIQGKLFTYNFTQKGHFNVKLKVGAIGSEDYDIDTKIIYINSRAPVADFKYSIPKSNKPNRVLLDATDSYDPDFTDNGKLKYSWEIDGQKVNLEDANSVGSVGYYTFDSIGDHTAILKVEDPDGIEGVKDKKVTVDSILSVDFSAIPRAIKRGDSISFKADSPEAKVFEWSFDDGETDGGTKSSVKHKYEKSGIYDVKLKVLDLDDNSNYITKTVYVGDGDYPVAVLDLKSSGIDTPAISKGVCFGNDAYIVDRANSVIFDAGESIDIDGENGSLDYAIKIGEKVFSSKTVSYKYDELGCFSAKLTVTSKKNRSSSSRQIWLKVENLEPSLSALSTQMSNQDSDPVIVEVTAEGAKDLDGVITSYLWYYYTDVDPEPQDFRATTSASTKFVLPRITGNYYFVVVLTDDNDSRVSSEDLSRKATISLVGDNVNVPLVDLKVNDSSVYIDEEVVFNSTVKNILGKNITKEATYYWDFDGDGFYDQETSSSTISHKYSESGEFYVKLKVKYKGFSNTRTVNINVANRLKADFDYISIGNTYIFINKSTGSYDKIVWDLGDGNKIEGKESFIYNYDDNKNGHSVKLLVSEGTTTKSDIKQVLRNVKNLLNSKKMDFVVFSSPELTDDKIVLETKQDYVYLYFGNNSGDIETYVVDTNSSLDSDLNGTKDDDEDLDNSSGDVFSVKLDSNREQKINLILKDEDGVTLNSKEITIVKEYIEFSGIDLDKLSFTGITDADKQKVDELKSIISDLTDQDLKLKSMMYLQKLQEEWFDDYTKTQVILEFEGFLEGTNLSSKDDIINLLESILVEGEEDKSGRNVTYNALVNLIPEDIICEYSTEYDTCKQLLVSKLDTIKSSNDLENNRLLGSEILSVIEVDTFMSAKDKLDFKAILTSLVYGGTENIPEDEVDDIISQDTGEETSLIKSIFYTLLKIVGILLGIFVVIFIGYFIYYKLSKKDNDTGLQDFILDKTKLKDNNKKDQQESKKDILGDFLDGNQDTKLKEDIKSKDVLSDEKTEKVPDWLSGIGVNEDDSNQNLQKTLSQEKANEDKVPNWLNSTLDKSDKTKNIESEIKNEKLDIKNDKIETEEVKTKEEKVPDWLKGNIQDEDKNQEETKKESKDEINSKNIKKQDLNIKEEKVPDWLKGSFTQEDKSETKIEQKSKEVTKEEKKSKKEDTEVKELKNKDLDSITSLEEDKKVPDWLKGSINEDSPKEKSKESKVPDWLKGTLTEEDKKELKSKEESKAKETKKEESKSSSKQGIKVKEDKKTKAFENKKVKLDSNKVSKEDDKTKTSSKKDNKKANITEDKKEEISELWDNGMDVPDWLKTDDADKK